MVLVTFHQESSTLYSLLLAPLVLLNGTWAPPILLTECRPASRSRLLVPRSSSHSTIRLPRLFGIYYVQHLSFLFIVSIYALQLSIQPGSPVVIYPTLDTHSIHVSPPLLCPHQCRFPSPPPTRLRTLLTRWTQERTRPSLGRVPTVRFCLFFLCVATVWLWQPLRPEMDMPPAFERDIPHRGSRHMALTHSYDNDLNPSDRYRGSNRALTRSLTSPSSPSSVPMPIPHMREEPPPPLPPPRHLADIEGGGHNGPDLAWQWENSRVSNEWGGSSVTPGSSLYGSMASSRAGMSGDAPEPARRTSSTSTIKSLHGAEAKEAPFRKLDEGYSSLSSASIDSYRSVAIIPLPGGLKIC